MDYEQQSFSIRAATPDDVRLLTELGRTTFEDTFAQYNTKEDMELYLAEQFSLSAVQDELAGEGNAFFILEWEGAPACYMKLRHAPVDGGDSTLPAIEIQRIYVTKDHLRKGLGSRMMEFCVEYCRRHDIATLWLGVWEKNESAIRFYEKWGFKLVGAHDFLLGKDLQRDLIMVKNLAI